MDNSDVREKHDKSVAGSMQPPALPRRNNEQGQQRDNRHTENSQDMRTHAASNRDENSGIGELANKTQDLTEGAGINRGYEEGHDSFQRTQHPGDDSKFRNSDGNRSKETKIVKSLAKALKSCPNVQNISIMKDSIPSYFQHQKSKKETVEPAAQYFRSYEKLNRETMEIITAASRAYEKLNKETMEPRRRSYTY